MFFSRIDTKRDRGGPYSDFSLLLTEHRNDCAAAAGSPTGIEIQLNYGIVKLCGDRYS